MSFRHMPAILVAAMVSWTASFTPSSASLIHDFKCDGVVFDCTGTLTLAEPMVGEFELFGLDFEAPMFSISGSPFAINQNIPWGFDLPGDPWALDEGSVTAFFAMHVVEFNVTASNVLSIAVFIQNGTGSYRETALLTPIHDVPEPAILAMFALGLAGLGIAARRRTSARR